MKTFSSFDEYLQDYENVEYIDKGTYGSVYRGDKNNKKFAFKFQLLKKSNSYEIDIARINHPNIIHFDMDTAKIKKEYYLIFIMPLGTSLSTLIRNNSLSKEKKWKYIYEVACGLGYLNQIGYYHCDLKPSNVIIYENRAMLIDFSLVGKGLTTVCNTALYRPLEFFLGEHFLDGQKADSWAFGCFVIYVLTGISMFYKKEKSNETVDDVVKNQILSFFKNPNPFYKQLKLQSDEIEFIDLFLKKYPNDRISMKDIFETKLFKKKNFKNPDIPPIPFEHSVYIPYNYNDDKLYQKEINNIRLIIKDSSDYDQFHIMDVIYRTYPFFQNKQVLYLALFVVDGFNILNKHQSIINIDIEDIFDYFLVVSLLLVETGGIYSKTIIEDFPKEETIAKIKPFLYNQSYSNSNYKERKYLVESLEN